MADKPIIKESNTDKDKTAKKDVPLRKLSQLEINLVEGRLVLTHGTLPNELGGMLANRFGKALKMHDNATTGLAYVDKEKDTEKRKKKTVELTTALADSKKLYTEEMRRFTKLSMTYIVDTYGKERRDPNGNITGYGDSIEVMKNHHIRKIW